MKLIMTTALALSTVLAPIGTQAKINPEHHKLCLKAQDYRGCIDVLSENEKSKSPEKNLSKDEQLKIDYLKLKEMSKVFPCPASQFIESKLPEIPTSKLKSLCREFASMRIDKDTNSQGVKPLFGIHKSVVFSRYTEKYGGLSTEFDQWLWDNYSIGENRSQQEEKSRKELVKAVKATNKYIGSDEYKSDQAHIARQRQQSQNNRCPPGTNMVTVDERWNVLFIRGGKKKEIGCMTPQQLADFNSRIHLQGQRQRQQAWRDLQRNRPVNCYSNSSTTGSINSFGGTGYSSINGSTYGSTTCY